MALLHEHDWEVIETYEVPKMKYTPWGMLTVVKRYVSVEKCKKCGKIRTQKVKL